MLRLVDPSSSQPRAGVRLMSKMFGVAKKDSHEQRVIIDRRRQNSMEYTLSKARRRLLLRTERAHAWAGSELASQKSRRKEVSATVWGATLDGERGEVSGERSSLQQQW